MKLSAPVHQLKRRAKLLSRQENVPLHEALDRIAAKEGFTSWSLLAARAPATPAAKLFASLVPGDLILVAARPGQGKILMSLRLAVEAMKSGQPSIFFTLEYTDNEILDRFRAIGAEPAQFGGLFGFDNSDDISADYISRKLAAAPHGTLVIVDYLQLLDQKRSKPELMSQVRTLQSFALEKGLTFVFISQIDRSYDPATKPFPGIEDIRLPNPVDLTLFTKTCFLHGGKIRFGPLPKIKAGPQEQTGSLPPRGHVMKAYQGSHRRFEQLYKKLAE